jgi:hypothetical protein
MNLSKAAAIILSSFVSVGAFVPSSIRRGDLATAAIRSTHTMMSPLKMSEAVIDAEPVDTDDGEKYE